MVNNKIKLGIIGYNEGNGHPYSFSAIINGYDSNKMSQCPYPVIYNYLEKRDESKFGIGNFTVDYIWTPNEDISNDVAACCNIPNIVQDYEQMIEDIDAVIIARDDAETHRDIAKPFLEQGKKVFIDKPLCKNLQDLEYFITYLENGQLMSCSGFMYHPVYMNKDNLDVLRSKTVCTVGITLIDWYKYGIHIMDAMRPIMNSNIISVHNIGIEDVDIVKLEYENGKYATVIKDNNLRGFQVNAFSNEGGHEAIVFNDNFEYFRNLLSDFLLFFLNDPNCKYDYKETINQIKALIAAQESKAVGQITL